MLEHAVLGIEAPEHILSLAKDVRRRPGTLVSFGEKRTKVLRIPGTIYRGHQSRIVFLSRLCIIVFIARLAQLVEQLIYTEKVGSSNLSSRTHITKLDLPRSSF